MAVAFHINTKRKSLFKAVQTMKEDEISKLKEKVLKNQIELDELNAETRVDLLKTMEDNGVISINNLNAFSKVLKEIDCEHISKILTASQDVRPKQSDYTSSSKNRTFAPPNSQHPSSPDVRPKQSDYTSSSKNRTFAPPNSQHPSSPGISKYNDNDYNKEKMSGNNNLINIDIKKEHDKNKTDTNSKTHNHRINIENHEVNDSNIKKYDVKLDQHMREFIASKLNRDWKRLGIKLGNEDIEDEIDSIDEDNKKLFDKSFAMIKTLKEQGIVLWSEMKKGLLFIPRRDIIRKFEEKFEIEPDSK